MKKIVLLTMLLLVLMSSAYAGTAAFDLTRSSSWEKQTFNLGEITYGTLEFRNLKADNSATSYEMPVNVDKSKSYFKEIPSYAQPYLYIKHKTDSMEVGLNYDGSKSFAFFSVPAPNGYHPGPLVFELRNGKLTTSMGGKSFSVDGVLCFLGNVKYYMAGGNIQFTIPD